jgi:hypothetical protein
MISGDDIVGERYLLYLLQAHFLLAVTLAIVL